MEEEWTLQMDNDPKHQSNIVQMCLREKAVHILANWPPNSPDLNPIENLWAILKVNVSKKYPKNIHDLELNIKNEWELLNIEHKNLMIKLVESMPERLEQVIKRKGYYSDFLF